MSAAPPTLRIPAPATMEYPIGTVLRYTDHDDGLRYTAVRTANGFLEVKHASEPCKVSFFTLGDWLLRIPGIPSEHHLETQLPSERPSRRRRPAPSTDAERLAVAFKRNKLKRSCLLAYAPRQYYIEAWTKELEKIRETEYRRIPADMRATHAAVRSTQSDHHLAQSIRNMKAEIAAHPGDPKNTETTVSNFARPRAFVSRTPGIVEEVTVGTFRMAGNLAHPLEGKMVIVFGGKAAESWADLGFAAAPRVWAIVRGELKELA